MSRTRLRESKTESKTDRKTERTPERTPGTGVAGRRSGNPEREDARFREDAAGRVRRMETRLLGILFEEAARELRLRGVETAGVTAEAAPERRKGEGRKTGRGKANVRRGQKADKADKADKAEKGLVAEFRDKVLGQASRTGMSDSRFGVMATGDPSLVRRLRRGGAPRLGTVDRVLAFLGEAPVAPAFLLEVEAFVEVTRTKESEFSREASGNQSFLTQLRRGALPRLDTADRVRTWMRTNCTAGEWGEIRSRVAAGLPKPSSVVPSKRRGGGGHDGARQDGEG